MKFKYFQVVLDNALDSAGTGEGFIDPREATDAAFSALPSTLALSRDKARANLRWKLILDVLKESGANDVTNIVVTGGDEGTPPTSIVFKVVYESDKLVHAYDLITDTSGVTLIGPTGLGSGETEVNVIERLIANSLSEPVTKERFVYDPTLLGGKNTITKKFETLTAANLATGATAVLRQTDLESPFTLGSVTVAVPGTSGGYSVANTMTVVGGTSTITTTFDIDEVVPVDAQDETNYNNTGANGTFAAGANYLANDVIILNDGTSITVDAVTSGAITQFTVNTGTTVAGQTVDATVLIQASVTAGSPTGSGFTLTLDTNNLVPFSCSVNVAGSYTVLPTTPNTATGSTGGTDDATFNLVYGGLNILVSVVNI